LIINYETGQLDLGNSTDIHAVNALNMAKIGMAERLCNSGLLLSEHQTITL